MTKRTLLTLMSAVLLAWATAVCDAAQPIEPFQNKDDLKIAFSDPNLVSAEVTVGKEAGGASGRCAVAYEVKEQGQYLQIERKLAEPADWSKSEGLGLKTQVESSSEQADVSGGPFDLRITLLLEDGSWWSVADEQVLHSTGGKQLFFPWEKFKLDAWSPNPSAEFKVSRVTGWRIQISRIRPGGGKGKAVFSELSVHDKAP
ncbi:MAG: hypothetical protein HY360_18010 [Verrucomicrobia bacterium]|nr:hypothetical protein [Verrucomicrobiota bacterium]